MNFKSNGKNLVIEKLIDPKFEPDRTEPKLFMNPFSNAAEPFQSSLWRDGGRFIPVEAGQSHMP
jgi:hypothetical protein